MTPPSGSPTTPTAAPTAALRDVSVTYQSAAGPVHALVGVDLAFPPATSTAVVGRSGSGKSTLVALLTLLRTPTSGVVEIDGIDVTALSDAEVATVRAGRVGIVFQSFHLEPSLTAAENVMLPWFFTSPTTSRRAARRRAAHVLEALAIGDLADRRPPAMSGGQRQRVAIGRALFTDPTLLVADEPTGNLDEDTAEAVADLLLDLPERLGTAVVLVTHDRDVARRAGRRVELARGRVVDAGGAFEPDVTAEGVQA